MSVHTISRNVCGAADIPYSCTHASVFKPIALILVCNISKSFHVKSDANNAARTDRAPGPMVDCSVSDSWIPTRSRIVVMSQCAAVCATYISEEGGNSHALCKQTRWRLQTQKSEK